MFQHIIDTKQGNLEREGSEGSRSGESEEESREEGERKIENKVETKESLV